MDWELMSEQIVRHVHESLPQDLDSPLSIINKSIAVEPSTAQESSSRETPSLVLEKNRWGEPCRDTWCVGGQCVHKNGHSNAAEQIRCRLDEGFDEDSRGA